MKRAVHKGKFSWVSLVPFLILIMTILLYFLISDGYDFFIDMGWNPGVIVFFRQLFLLAIMVGFFSGFTFLMRFYLETVKSWKKGSSYSDFPKPVEISLISLVLVGASLLLLTFAFVIISLFLFADPSFWHGYWELD